LPFSVVLSSALIERIFDGLWLVFLFFLTTRFVPLPRFLIDGGWLLLILLVVAGDPGLVMFRKHHRRPPSRTAVSRKALRCWWKTCT